MTPEARNALLQRLEQTRRSVVCTPPHSAVTIHKELLVDVLDLVADLARTAPQEPF